ncbi:MAG: DUF4215 domain-containing protein, partial [Spirochaetia bacterium]|nr:DUF4215 domain-containing protein [Spirochaetia bacterium]
IDTDDCTNSCQIATCGDGITWSGGTGTETCDDANGIDTDDCTNSCQIAACGDGIIWSGGTGTEVCDDANGIDTDDCTNSCQIATCGDGVIWSGGTGTEVCDDANGIDTDDCTNSCQIATCGDGITWSGGTGTETCDDAGSNSDVLADACRTTCVLPSCGDNVTDTGEDCDTAGQSATCEADCLAPFCGDSVTNTFAGEDCDDGGVQTALCEANCAAATCGDGIINTLAGEACDDGNLLTGDGCDDFCAIEWGTNPIITNLSITGTPTGGGGNYVAGDSVTISWSASDSDGIFGYVIMLAPDFDVQGSTGEPPTIYNTGFDPFSMIPGGETSHTFTLPDAYGQSYYPILMAVDNNFLTGNGGMSIAVYDSLMAVSSFSLLIGDPDDPASYYIQSGIPASSITYEPNGYFCSDGATQLPEQCDDGGLLDGDGCSASCEYEPPGTVCSGTHPLQSITTDNTLLDLSLAQKATVTLTADYSCTESVTVEFYEPVSMTTKILDLSQTGVGVFEVQFPENIYYPDGIWEVTKIEIYDLNKTNLYTYIPTGLNYKYDINGAGGGPFNGSTVPEMSTIETINGTSDTIKPTLNSITVTGTPGGINYQMGDTLSISANITDNLSGVDSVIFAILDQSFKNYGMCLPILTAPDTYECDAVFTGNGFNTPAYTYVYVYAVDIAQNDAAFLASYFEPTNYFESGITDTGVAASFFTLDVPLPPIYASLTVGDPQMPVAVIKDNEIWFEFDVISGGNYTVYWNDTSDGDAFPTADVLVEAFDSLGNTIFFQTDDGFTVGQNFFPFFAPPSTGKIYLRVMPKSDGDFGIWVTGPVCGDGTIDISETCDDTNTVSYDGCAATCIDTEGPVVDLTTLSYNSVIGPSGLASYEAGDVISVSVDITDLSAVNTVTFAVYDENLNNSYGSCIGAIVIGNTYQCNITFAGLTSNGTEHVYVYADDIFGNQTEYTINSLYSSVNYTNNITLEVASSPLVFVPYNKQPVPVFVNNGYKNIPVTQLKYAAFNAVLGNTYIIYWDDILDGTGTYSGDIQVSAYYFDMSPIFTNIDSGYTTGQQFTAIMGGPVYIELSPVSGGSVGVEVTSVDEPTTTLLADFESGSFGVSSPVVTWTATGLWHISTSRTSEGTFSARYADQTLGTYEAFDTSVPPNSIQSMGTLDSGTFTAGSSIAFDYLLINECTVGTVCGFDYVKVYISTDGFATAPFLLDNLPGNSSAGVLETRFVDTTGYFGQTVQIRFEFNTLDGFSNNHEGAYIDNIRVY